MAELLRSTWSHVVNGKKIRRMSVAEIAAIQGFPAEWVNVDGITESERIAVLGNAVPPPLSHVLADLLKEKGAADPRDVMGFTPTAIAACEPEVFLFLFPSEFGEKHANRQYATKLLDSMNKPKDGMKYGLATRYVNAADYGLAQIRNYFVVMGIKGLSNTKAYAVLRKLSLYQSHHDPTILAIGKKKWVTLGDLFYSKNYSA